MRHLTIISICLLSACSAAEPEQAPQAKADKIDQGLWEIATEVANLVPMDKGEPLINTPQGTKASVSGCVAEGERKRPPAALIAGLSDKCTYKNIYMSNGRINASMACRRDGLQGDMMTTVEGTYTADSIDGTVGIDTYFSSHGDVKLSYKLAGKRVGSCPAGGGEASNSANAS